MLILATSENSSLHTVPVWSSEDNFHWGESVLILRELAGIINVVSVTGDGVSELWLLAFNGWSIRKLEGNGVIVCVRHSIVMVARVSI